MCVLLVLVAGINLSLLQNSTLAVGKQHSSVTQSRSNSAGQTSNESVVVAPAVGPTQPVITVRGVCDKVASKEAAAASSCAKVITREQFEILINALNPDGPALLPNARRNLAKTYADYLALEAAVHDAGIENNPEFRALIEWTRLRATSDFYRHNLQEKYRTPSQAEIDAYYHQHLADYERVKLVRILVPRENPSAPDKNEFDKKAKEAANASRMRAVKGEDPAQIQKDAYTAVGLAAPPSTDLGDRLRADLIPEEGAEVFGLKPGEVSQVQAETKSYVIYKVISKDALPEDQVKTEISREIYQRKFKDAMKAVIDATPANFNEHYFGSGTGTTPSTTPALPARPPNH